MSLKSALGKIGNVLGDVAKTAFNAIPLIPNIPADKFSNSAIAKVSGVVSGITDIAGNVAANLIPGGTVIKSAANIIGSLVPSTKAGSKASSALPSSIPTNGATSMTLQSTVRTIASPIIAGVSGISPNAQVPNTIGLFQNTAAAPTSVGSKMQIPVNSSGLGYFTQEVPPVAITSGGMIAGSAGLLGQAPGGIGDPSSLLPTSDPLQKIIDAYGKTAQTSNTPTNPTTPQMTSGSSNLWAWFAGGIMLFSLVIGFLFAKRK